MAYIDLARFRLLSVMPGEDIDALETRNPGWIDAQAELVSRGLDARLNKRYATPFLAPYPAAVEDWITRILTKRAYVKRGVDPSDQQFVDVAADAQLALDEIKEAADATNGLFELPLRADLTANGITRGGPFGRSEQSPYAWTTEQARIGRDEDRNGSGSGDG